MSDPVFEPVESVEEQPPPGHPDLIVLPYLPISPPVKFGQWWLGSLDSFTGTWLSPAFEQESRRLISTFRDVSGKPLKRPSILVRSDSGADGVPPSREEYEALLLSIGFATIHQNRYWMPDGPNDGSGAATTDNAALWLQPIDLVGHWITLGRGARVHTLAGGYRYTDDGFVIPAPFELHTPFALTLDAELLEALYTTLLSPPAGCEHAAASLGVAIRWLMKSWQNTPSITWEDRLVFVKVATEALTGEEKNADSAKKLARIFATTMTQEGKGIGIDDLLWSPSEAKLTRHWTQAGKPKSVELSEFEHWACALGDARNAIVHGESETIQVYEADGSPYRGSFVEVGDRVVREAITVILGECGFPSVWRRQMTRASFRVYQALVAAAGSESDMPPCSAPSTGC